MFNENWLALAGFAVILGLLMRENGLLTVSALLLSVAGAGWVWNKYSLRAIGYQRRFSESRAFLGEDIDLTLQITNHKWLPVGWLRIDDEYPLPVTLFGGDLQPSTKADVGFLSNLVSLRWLESARLRYHLHCVRRGFYAFGPAHLRSGDIFGLFSSQFDCPQVDWLIVYPEVKPIEGLSLPPKEPFGDVKARQRIFEDPSRAIGAREYQASDALKHIHWKATARRQRLQTKVYEPTTTFQLVIILNMATLPKHWQGTIPELLERAISVAASIASCAAKLRCQVGLIANGCWPESDQALRVLPGRSPDQLTLILEALAAVGVQPTISIEELLSHESSRLPWAATLLVVTAVVTEELLAMIVRLQRAGRRVVLVRLDEEPVPVAVDRLLVQRVEDLGTSFHLVTEDAE